MPIIRKTIKPKVDSAENDSLNQSESTRTLRRRSRSKKIDNMPRVPNFLSKTYKMFDECDPSIASWTDDGEMIEIKDQDRFEKEMIPKNFNHSNFSSFARQLNFYGFCKIPSRELRRNGDEEDGNRDSSNSLSSVVTFHNEFFKRGRHDLLKNIQRSTNTQKNPSHMDQQEEIENLKSQIEEMRQVMLNMERTFEDQITRMENDFQRRIDKMQEKYFVEGISLNTTVGGQFERSWENRRNEINEEYSKEAKNAKKEPSS